MYFCLILKGPASSIQLYGDPFVREYTDLDILVNLHNIDPIIPLMAELGWVADDYHPAKGLSLANSRLIQRCHHVTFWKEGRPFRVEIHDRTGWDSELFKRDDIDAVFSRAIFLDYPGGKLPAPDLPDHSLLIVTHGVQHAWSLLHWILDAAAILACKDEALHASIAARAVSLGMRRQLKLTCELVRKLYPITLSQAIESAILDERKLDNAVDFAFAQLQLGGRGMTSIKNILAFQVTYSLPLLHGLREKAASLFKLALIPQIDMEAVPLPRPLRFLHIPLRPFFIASRRLKRLREKRAVLHG